MLGRPAPPHCSPTQTLALAQYEYVAAGIEIMIAEIGWPAEGSVAEGNQQDFIGKLPSWFQAGTHAPAPSAPVATCPCAHPVDSARTHVYGVIQPA